MTAITPGERIPIGTAPNLRDLGGWPTRDGGVVRRGLVYRSAELAKLSGDDLVAFAALGIRTVYDLRTQAERTTQPDNLPAPTRLTILDVLADETGAAPAQLAEALHDPAAAAAELGGGKAQALFVGAYGDLVTLPSAIDAYRRLFTELADDERRPALFHCTTGKDRTGWAAAALLMLVGVDDDDVMRDYLLTNDELLPQLRPIFDRFETAGGDPALLLPVLGVDAAYLTAALERMRSTYGGVDTYFRDGLGLDLDTITRLRTALVEGA
jgi:protein-tyrosine phosphatase